MDEHALRVLEFDKVRERLARLASFSAGRELAEALTPSTSYETVLERQQLLAEAIKLRQLRSPLSLSSAVDIRAPLEKASLGGSLDPLDLLAVGSTLKVSQQVKSALERAAASLPLLANLAQQLTTQPELSGEIDRSIDPQGEVLDTASQALGVIRRDIKISHDRLHSRLQDFLSSSGARNAVQENIVTLRDGRYVIPIKADFRGEVRGIVHDVSASGATVFIEPLVVVELANQWRELQIEERREIERVLRRLSGLVGGAATVLEVNVLALAELDLLLAAARLGEELGSGGFDVLPNESASGQPDRWLLRPPAALEFVQARHPLLATPVPVSLRLGDDNRVLLITGPNTGGKTVALKTVGLLAVMAQAGLPVAAANGSQLPVFGEVLADIGDEQSIEQSLSTFSGHLKNIVSILDRVGPDSLVLLDELAAGTDPAEGSALARALLQHLLDSGGLTMATTHHGELKLFAYSTDGIQNAAVDFDAVTLTPTYRITIGVPGRSNALAIAARLGLPEAILRAAQDSIAPEEVAIDSLLAELRTERDAASEARRGEEQARSLAERARAQVEERLAGIDEERARRLDEAAMALEEEVEAAREALKQAQRLAERQAPITSRDAEEVQEASQAISSATDTARRLRRRSRRRRREVAVRAEQVLPGASVWMQGIPMAAEVLSIPDRRGDLDVSFGGLRARVQLGQIVRIDQAPRRPPERSQLPTPPAAASEQIEVRGQTLDEALPRIEKFLDDGFRAGIPRLRVVHGKGTGKMRQAVRQLLSRHPLVKGFDFAAPAEGGEGVTVVEMG